VPITARGLEILSTGASGVSNSWESLVGDAENMSRKRQAISLSSLPGKKPFAVRAVSVSVNRQWEVPLHWDRSKHPVEPRTVYWAGDEPGVLELTRRRRDLREGKEEALQVYSWDTEVRSVTGVWTVMRTSLPC